MELDRAASTLGTVASLALAALVFAPYVLVTERRTGLFAYYAAGPVGASAVGFLALLCVVVFLSGRHERRPPDLIAGVSVVLGVALLVLAVLWATAVDSTVLYSFPPRYAWLSTHRWAVVGGSVLVAASGGLYAKTVL